MSDKFAKRPTALLVGSYGEVDGNFSKAAIEDANRIAYELGRAFIDSDIDIAIGGRFGLATPFAAGADFACKERGIRLRDRLTYYYAKDWPPADAAPAGKLFEIDDTDNFWLRVLQQVDSLVAFSGRESTKAAIECAELIGKDIFPFGTVDGASSATWKKYFSPDLRFLGDRSIGADELAKLLSEAVLSRFAEKKTRAAPHQTPQCAVDGDILVLVHGIRTEAAWAELVKTHIEAQTPIKVYPIRYGFFDLIRFLSPLLTRGKPISRLKRELTDIRFRHPNARISALAHSFGCYALLEALKEPTIKLHKVAFCGSVAPNIRVLDYGSRIEFDPILNDCGTRDVLPALAQASTWGYGATGTFGFGTIGIRDRFHPIPHSGFFTSDFVNRFWVPFFSRGEITESGLELSRETPAYSVSILAKLPLRWLILLAIASALALLAPSVTSSLPKSLGFAVHPTIVSLDLPPRETVYREFGKTGGERAQFLRPTPFDKSEYRQFVYDQTLVDSFRDSNQAGHLIGLIGGVFDFMVQAGSVPAEKAGQYKRLADCTDKASLFELVKNLVPMRRFVPDGDSGRLVRFYQTATDESRALMRGIDLVSQDDRALSYSFCGNKVVRKDMEKYLDRFVPLLSNSFLPVIETIIENPGTTDLSVDRVSAVVLERDEYMGAGETFPASSILNIEIGDKPGEYFSSLSTALRIEKGSRLRVRVRLEPTTKMAAYLMKLRFYVGKDILETPPFAVDL